MNKLVMSVLALFLSTAAYGDERMDCGTVTIDELLTGPRHGSMMRVSNRECGNSGYVCLDPDGEVMSKAESDRLYSFVLAQYTTGKTIRLYTYTDRYAQACGSYPVAEDVRS